MKYVIKVKGIYVEALNNKMWTKFTAFLEDAQRFDTPEEAENAKKSLLDPTMYRTFKTKDVEIIEVKE